MKGARLFVLGGAIVLLGAIALLLDWGFGSAPPQRGMDEGISSAALMAVSFPDLTGQEQPLGQWQGKLLIINFWATWCAPCREEMPAFNRLHQKYSPKGLQIVGIAVENADKVAQFANEIGVSYILLAAPLAGTELSSRLGNRRGYLPHTVVIAPDGSKIFSKIGIIDEKEFEAIIIKNLPK